MRNIKIWFTFVGLIFSSFAFAGQWKPLCIEGGICKLPQYYPIIDPNSASPQITSDGFLLQYRPTSYSSPGGVGFHLILADAEGVSGPILNSKVRFSSDMNTIELPSGKKLNFTTFEVGSWLESDDEIFYTNYSGSDVPGIYHFALTSPPVVIGEDVYIGIGGHWIYRSEDEGLTWKKLVVFGSSGQDRYNLSKNPEGDSLWTIHSETSDSSGSLWESTDRGESWAQVDDGSFPVNTVRVVHDPMNSGRSYALTDHGLFVSLDRGVNWQETDLAEAVHSLLFIERGESEPRAVVISTDTGVRISTDEMSTWVDTSSGLLAQPHSVTFGDGLLIATSESGYYSCPLIDCIGTAQALASEEDRGLVDVVEFYHPDLDHYFITATIEEATAIDQGAAGPGWVRTGEQFSAWRLGGSDLWNSSNVCRFYGSQNPGPNSHFYSASASECKFLMDLQELVPDGKPRWNFEGYAFTVPPVATDGQPCPETAIPVYRAYNNGFAQGKDSNHRYLTDPDLMNEMVSQGWIDEGIAFCSPAN